MAKKKKPESSFFDDLLKRAGVDIPTVSNAPQKPVTFYDTGSLILNALLSGSMLGGISNKITVLAGEESTGKTFIALQIIRNFLDRYPTANVIVFDSEDDPSKGLGPLVDRKIDPDRIRVTATNTIQDFKVQVNRITNQYLAEPVEGRPPLLLCLDSLGNLASTKEAKDTDEEKVNAKGEEIKDMSKPALLRGLFRVLSVKIGEAQIPMLITNHTYESMDPYGTKRIMSGGGGAKYSSSSIVFLGKKKHYDTDKSVIGSILTASLEKSRFTRQGKKAELLLAHDYGLDKYWGLFELGKELGLLPLVGKVYEFPDGQTASRKEIEATPAKYFDTKVNFDAFEALCNKTFKFGNGETPPDEDEGEETEIVPAEPPSDYEGATAFAHWNEDSTEQVKKTLKKKQASKKK